MNRTDANHVSEVVLMPILSQLFHCPNLRNLNEVERLNYPGIDLADDEAKVAFQITSTPNSAKIKETLATFVNEELYTKYERLIFYIISQKQRSYSGKGFDALIQSKFQFDKDRDIVDYRDLLEIISFLQIEDTLKIQDLLEANFGDIDRQPVNVEAHEYPEIEPYLQRRVCETNDAGPFSLYLLDEEKMYDLSDVIERERRAILLCDAGVGKSTELKRIAALYSKPGSRFHVKLICLNKYVNQSLPEMLCAHWAQVPEDQLLVILDGLDEIESKNRSIAIRWIESFSEDHPEVHLVVSCRTNFYNRESAESSGTLQDFASYTLLDLNDDVINAYLSEILGNRKIGFFERVDENQLHDLLRSPFYLTRLVSLFRENGSLPQTKAGIFEELIHHSLRFDIEKFRTTDQLKDKREEIIETLEKLALAMETLGRNYISNDEYRKLVPDSFKRDLIEYCTLWHKRGAEEVTWQFDHNNFQEYLAARLLARQPLSAIKSFISFEPAYPKIIPSWTNALSFLLSILDSGNTKLTDLIEWVGRIEPEIIFHSEPDKIPIAVRQSYLREIFQEYKHKEIAIDYEKFSYRQLARFGQSAETVRYLMDEADGATAVATLVNAISLLRYVKVPYEQRERAAALFERYAKDANQEGYARYVALLALTDHSFNSREVIDRIISAARSSTDDHVRHGLYYMILKSKYLDDNIDVFLDGIEHAGGIDPTGGSTTLAEGLDSTRTPRAVNLVLSHMKSRPGLWSRRTFLEDHVPAIISNAANAYSVDSTVYQTVKEVLYALSLSYHHKEAALVSSFFDITNTRFAAFKDVLLDRENCQKHHRDWFDLLALLADDDGLSLFAYLYSKNALSERDVWAFQNSLGGIRGDLFVLFNALINKVSNNQFVLPPSRDRNAEARQMSSLNFELLFDKQAFSNAIVLVFEGEQTNELSLKGIDRVFQNGDEHGQKYSTLALQSLWEIAKSNKDIVTKDVAIRCIEASWEQWSILKIHKYMTDDPGTVLATNQRQLITRWCEANLRQVDFRTAIVVNADGSWSPNSVATMLWFFQRRLDLSFPEDVMLDMLSFELFGESGLKGIEYFEDRLDPTAMTLRILENLDAGIESPYVLKNHLDYCRRHHVVDVVPFALREIVSPKSDSWGRHDALDTVLSFPEAASNLEKVLPQITDNFKWPILSKLIEQNSQIGIDMLRTVMKGGDEEESLRAALYLMEVQDLEALRYYVEHIEQTRQYPAGLTEKSPLRYFQSAEALPLLLRLLRISVDPSTIVADQFSFLYNIVLDAMSRIALASHESFDKIRDALKEFIRENKTELPNVKILHFQISRLERTYYTNLAQKLSLNDVLAKLSALTDSNRNLVTFKALRANTPNALIRSTGIQATTDSETDAPGIEREPKQDFPRITVSPEVTTWLKAAYTQLREGKQINPTEMLVGLWSTLPEDFDYNSIDSRLMRFGVDLTLLGVLHVDATTDLVEKTDRVIRFIRELIRKQPSIEAITSQQLSEDLTIPEGDVALILGLISHLGDFWNGGAGHGKKPGYYAVTIRDEKVKREYLKYRSIEELLNKLAGDSSNPNRGRRTMDISTADDNRQVDVCLSFAGENRQYVERVAEALRALGVELFYDRYEQASLWGRDLYQHLDEVYRKRAKFCVVFISEAYSQKLWTKHELRSAQARALEENREYILPVRLDDTELPGVLPTIGYIRDKSPEELAELINQKLQQTKWGSAVTAASSLDIVNATQQITLRDGSAASAEQRAAFINVWSSLVALEEAGRKLWEEVTGEGLAAFADRQREAQQSISTRAIFFSESDYEALEEVMRTSDFYLNGKTKLSDIYNGRVETQALNLAVPTERDTFMNQEVCAQIRQNRRWLTRYQNLLRDIRGRFHSRIG
jgi:hypothetical protein